MGRRWTQKEEEALVEVKRRLKDQLANRPQFPEVVGDRRIMRFLRGKALNVDESTKMISAFLKWRDDFKVDDVRQDIVYGGKDSPFKFPFGKIIIDIAPQIVQSAVAMDKKGRPVAMEMFDFSPKEVLDAISIADYLVFLTYSLEYRALILEQMSHEREKKYLAEHPDPNDRTDGYGVVILDYTIRDLKGVGFGHLGSKGRALVGAALELGLPNYQEYLGKCVMINTPWVFNTFWYFVKGFLDEETIAKINLVGGNYMPTLLEDLTFENIPERIGGGFKLYNEPFEFDIAPGGALYCEQHEKKIKSSNSNDIGNKRNHNHVTQRGSKDQLHLSIDTDTPARSLVARNSSSNESSGSSRRPPPSAFPRKTEIPWPETPPTTPFAGAGGSGGSGGGAGSERHLSGTSVGGPASRTAAATLLYPRVQRAGRLSVISAKRPYSAFFYSSPQTPPGPEPESSSFSRSPPLQSRDNNNNNSNHPLAPQSAPCDDAERATDHHPARQEWLAQEESQSTVSSLSTVTDFAAETSFREDCGESVKSKINTSQQQGIAERFLLKSGNIEPNAPISHTNSPNLRSEASVPVMEEQWLVVSIFFSIFGSIWKEWCEFLSSLCVVCTQYPFKTIAVVSIIALFCYLRCLDKLHLMAFPVLFLSALTYFELFR